MLRAAVRLGYSKSEGTKSQKKLTRGKGTVSNPIPVRSAGVEQFAGCTGYPADSHNVIWLTVGAQRVGRAELNVEVANVGLDDP